MRRTASIALAALMVTAAACSSDDGSADTGGTLTTDAPATDAPATDSGDADPTDTGTGTGTGDGDEAGAADTAADGASTTIAAPGEPEVAKPEPARTAGEVDAPPGVEPEGFSTVTVRVTSADGEVCDVCLWLADAGDERGRGLMGVTDLGDPVGMLFRWDGPTSGNFFMFNTPMPLSIAWFDPLGAHVFDTDMEPCLVADSSECERYGPGAAYQMAIEMVQGELGTIGIGPGSVVEVLAEHDTCPVIE